MNTPSPRPIDLRDFWLSKSAVIVVCGIVLFVLALPARRGSRFVDVQVTSAGSTYTIRARWDTKRFLGDSINAEDLVARFERRRAAIGSGPDAWTREAFAPSDYSELYNAAEVLIEVKHPKTLEILIALFEDPTFHNRALGWLGKLGDTRTGSYLLESWKKHLQYASVYVPTFQKFPYEPAVPYIIDAFGIPIPTRTDHTEDFLSTIERITAESLDEFRGRRIHDKDSLERFKADLHEWWSAYNAG